MRNTEPIRDQHPVADLAFYAARDLSKTDWHPFITAALERNPVILEATQSLTIDQLIETLQALPNESVYDATRVAQPDEVWNYQRGDGLNVRWSSPRAYAHATQHAHSSLP